jgi:hypothetical protein
MVDVLFVGELHPELFLPALFGLLIRVGGTVLSKRPILLTPNSSLLHL